MIKSTNLGLVRWCEGEMSQTRTVLDTIEVPLDQIKPSPYQPRLTFNLEDIRGSIQRDGILVPLTVRKKDGYYELIDGERRVRLARELGYKVVPCTIIDVDDETARRIVWKVNTLRQEYTPKEKAHYFRKLQEKYGMSLRGIARDCDYHPNAVKAHLNVFKLPQKYQELIWDRGSPLTVGHIQELEPLFDSGVLISTITDRLDLIIERKLTVHEFRDVLRPDLEAVRERRIEAAKEVVKEVAPVPEEIKLETPEELEEAARVLAREAKRRKTPQQRREEIIEKTRASINSFPSLEDAEELGIDTTRYREELKEIRSYLKEDPQKAADVLKTLRRDFATEKRRIERERREAQLIEEAKKKAEAELREKALREAEEKLLEDQDFMERAATEAIKRMQAPGPIERLPMPPSPEQFEAMRRSMQEVQERTRAILEKPEVKEHGRLFRNLLGHETILNVLASLQCPECGRDWKNLVWKCHDLNIKDSYERAHEKYQKAILKREK